MKQFGVRGRGARALVLFCSLLAATGAQATDVWLYKVTKGIWYQQSLSGAPTVLPENGYVFQANVFLTAAGNASGATIVSQEGTVRSLGFDDTDELEFRNKVNTKSTLETRYPDGNFRFTINTAHDGTRTPTLPLFGNTYPNAPYIDNISNLQAQNANGYIVVTWQPLAGGTADDFIQLRIEDSAGDLVWETDDLGEAGALDGTSTFALIKAGKLKPATRYAATLLFEKSCGRDTTSYPGAFGWSTYHARTQFTIGTTAAAEPSVETYDVSKGRSFEQTNSAPPVPDAGNEFIFRANVEVSAPGSVVNASLVTPAGQTLSIMRNADCGGEDFEYSASAPSQSVLDAQYPSGSYRFIIQTASQGTRTLDLPLSGASYPPAPRLQFDPTVKIRADGELRLAWDAWPGGTANDFIQLRIEEDDCDNAFETPDFDDKDALDGRATGAVIPAGTLQPGKSYNARLSFHRCVAIDSSNYPGALGQALYFARTKFKIRTVAPDVKNYEVRKGRIFVQSGPGAPVATGFVFTATLEAESASSIVTAAMVTPQGRTAFLVQQSDGETFRFRDIRTTQAALDTDYPDGNYVLAINGATDGGRNAPVALVGAVYPNAPRLNNYDAAGQIDAAVDFPLRWDGFAGGTADDFIDVEIEETDGDEVFDTAGYGKGEALTGLNTSVTLPANTLEASRMYHGKVYFEKVLRANDAGYAGVEGRVGYSSQTFVSLATSGPGNPSGLSVLRVAADGRMQLTLTTLNGASYEIQGSPDLRNWTTVGTVSATSNRTVFVNMPPAGARSYFYRVRWMR
jgi:hypothetical protein